jgi:2-oxo-4-hydroxy-4-carboxy--5-ureidoimidazoline (OHCU) decarboxylase
MTDEQFISGFLAVFETKPEVFEQVGAVDDLANLTNTISQMADKSNKEVADAIGDWCTNYPKITDEINKFERKLKPEATKKEGQEPKLSNRYPELPKNLKKHLPNS